MALAARFALSFSVPLWLALGSAPLAAELPVAGSFRDTASCEAVRTLAGEEASTLSETNRALLGDAVQDGVTMDAARVAGPGGWLCSFPQVWEVRAGDRWMAMAACEAGSDFFPAIVTLERLEEARYRLRLGDGVDTVEMIPCEISPPEAPEAPAESPAERPAEASEAAQ